MTKILDFIKEYKKSLLLGGAVVLTGIVYFTGFDVQPLFDGLVDSIKKITKFISDLDSLLGTEPSSTDMA